MKSIKPGRGPSMLGGAVGIIMICFGIFWTVMASKIHMGIAVFGILWTLMAVVITVYNFKNATNKNRYSSFDITDSKEESDPLNERFGTKSRGTVLNGVESESDSGTESRYCPYCGNKVENNFEFCNKCGKRLP